MPSGTLVPLESLGVGAAVIVIAFAILFFRLASRFDPKSATSEWLNGFTLERYAPMERLLDASDFEFLARRCPGRPELAKQLLAERRSIFREYLGLLVEDFNQLHFLAKLMLVHADEDRPEFAGALFRQQVQFYFSVGLIRCKVALYPLGWTALDVPRLLHTLERLRTELQAGARNPLPSPNA
jgi:hypothetical protein